MQTERINIDAVVAEVVRRLRRGQAGLEREAKIKTDSNTNEYRLNEKLITLETIAGISSGITKLIVLKGAVITPAVKDELNQKGICFERSSGGEVNKASRVWVGFDDEMTPEKSLVKTVEAADKEIHRGSLTTLIQQIPEAEDLALIVTDQPAKGACLANRNPNRRAAVVHDLAEANEVITTMKANVLFVQAKKIGANQFKQILSRSLAMPGNE